MPPRRLSEAAILGIGLVLGAGGMWLLRAKPAALSGSDPAGSAAPLPEGSPVGLDGANGAPRRMLETELSAQPAAVPAPTASAVPTRLGDAGIPSPFPRLDATRGEPIQPWMWQTMGPTPRLRTPDSEFAAKYPETMTAKELTKLYTDMLQECSNQAQDLGAERQSRGHFEEVLIPIQYFEDGKGYEFFPDKSIEPEQGYGPDYDDYPFKTISPPQPPHFMETRVMWLPFNEFPELYRREDEGLYLRRRAALARAAEKAAAAGK